MPRVILPTPLVSRLNGENGLEAAGSTAGEALRDLERRRPALRGWVLDDRGALRQHVSVFVGNRRVGLEQALAPGDELWIVQAISGGSAAAEVLVGTKKGLFVLRGDRGAPLRVTARQFAGQVVEYAMRDRRTGRYFTSSTHGQFGPHLFWSESPEGPWQEARGLAFDEADDAAVRRVWVVESGVGDGVLWAGAAPASLWKSEDGGETWSLNRALWNDPTRPQWEGGAGGLCLHSICPWPDDPRRLTVAMSSVGVWYSEDGGASWSRRSRGLMARYLPQEARDNTIMHCVHKLEQSPVEPETFYQQFHGGVYRSDDAGRSWVEIGRAGENGGLPHDFGFPVVVHPSDPDRAWVIPMIADVDRVTPEGKLRVYETADRGSSWRARAAGLPQEDAWVTNLRQAFCHDGEDPLGLYFGDETGTVYASADEGATWVAAIENLPPISSVRVA